MIIFDGKRTNGYTAISTRKLLIKLITCVYPVGHNKPAEECCLFGLLIRGRRDL